MAVIKVSEVAKRAEMSVDEAVSRLKEAGLNVSSGEDTVREEDFAAIGNDGRYQQLDRRQEMLKKALERHKRGVKIKEVFVNKGGPQDQQQQPSGRKVSKEDLMKKRTELDMRLKKVDEDRETIIKERAATPADSAPVQAPAEDKRQEPVVVEEVKPQVQAPVQDTPPKVEPQTQPATTAAATEPQEKPIQTTAATEGNTQQQQRKPATDNRENRDTRAPRPQGDRPYSSDRPQGDRPYTPRPQGDRPQGDRPYTPRPQGDRPYNSDRPQGDRPYTPRPQGDRQYSSDRPQGERTFTPRPTDGQRTGSRNDGTNFARPYTPRPAGSDGTNFARPYTPRPAGQGLQGDRPQGDRPYNRDNRPQGDRPYQPRNAQGGDKPYGQRPQYDRDRGPQGGNRPGQGMGTPRFSGETGLALTAEEERKRLAKKKEDDAAKEKDSKKPKAKKDVKKPKSWVKTINEGIDELNIEHEVEHKTIAPNIDISDLVDVDSDKKRFRSGGYNKSGFDKRGRGRKGGGDKSAQKAFVRPDGIEIGERVIIADFGSLIGVKATELIKKLFGMGIMATVNQSIDAETAQLIGIEYGVDVIMKTITEDDLLPTYEEDDANLSKRPPIVTVMGHVDHGKTSLLDAIRSTSVAMGEAGGITQHIGAYEVESASGKIIFLDTPGHEAFTTLRARGALLTDIVILVVAADDGVKPQTKEAIDHAKAAGVRIVVAINKIDKEGANPDNVRRQLAEYGIIGDDWGGEYQFQEISAKKRTGIDDLLERVLLEADVLDLKGNPNRPAEGIVIESRLDKQKGPVATVLVKNGSLKKGDTFVSGSQYGKVRAMFNFKGMSLKEAGVSIPAEVMGFSEVPDAGEKFIVTDEKTAKQVAELRALSQKEKQQAERGKLTLADFFGKIKDGELKELNIILKADAQGSLEALSSSLMKLSNQEVKVNIIHDGLGAITESDVALANASNAIIIGFNVRPDNNARTAAEREQIDIELYSVIYKAIDDVKLALEGLLSPEMKENILGRVEVRQVFSVPKIGKIAGCFVLEGKVIRNSQVRIVRDSIVVFDGKISSLKRFTEDTKEVMSGYECGISIDKFQDIKEKDIFEIYEMTEEKRTLEDVAKQEDAKQDKK